MKIGFVGFGEAAYHIAQGLEQPGIASITAFDIQSNDKIRQRAREAQTRLLESNRELAASCDIMLSAVTADAGVALLAGQTPHRAWAPFHPGRFA